MRLSDTIEQFIKEMMTPENQQVELKRNELADYFSCAPSQINYVLATRFTPSHGYIIESQRGGGGYIRIFRMRLSTADQLKQLLSDKIGNSVDALTAKHILQSVQEAGLITQQESAIMNAALSPQAFSLPIPEAVKDTLRARILTQMLLQAARQPDQPMGEPDAPKA